MNITISETLSGIQMADRAVLDAVEALKLDILAAARRAGGCNGTIREVIYLLDMD
jgi:hypothetical protein